jgi:UDP-N-acetylmuramoylalanine--D-glutamate ligase
MLDLRDQTVLVLGLGSSGQSAARFCHARGARVIAADERTTDEIPGADALGAVAELHLGAPLPDPSTFDLVVPSPGVPPERYRERARRVWGDVEIAGRTLAVPIVAVTGTNGKSTTTTLIESMLRSAGLRARAAGNLGTPALELVGVALDVAVLEVSSFQLETVESFRPDVAVVLNVAPDHLDRHGSLEAYAAAKARLLAKQRAEDVAVLNADDPITAGFAEGARGEVLYFSTTRPVARGAWLDAEAVMLRHNGEPPTRLSLDGASPAIAQNRENLLAALCAVAAIGAEPAKAWRALARFEGLAHRTQVVAERDGVVFVDDSKATNPAAALRSLASFDAPLVWIAGGRDKGLDVAAMAREAAPRLRAAVLLGEAAPRMERALESAIPVRRAQTIEDATALAAELARPGDVVLLSPGCSSLDQFASFEERGLRFRDAALAPRDAGEAGS